MIGVKEGCSLKDKDEKDVSCKSLEKRRIQETCKIFVNFSEAPSENVNFL